MSTSLAQQLGALQVQQKDEVQIASRCKVSFLFDVKNAANIDDQTLYYICQSGLQELSSILDLSSYKTTLLSENSLQFYRGSKTKDELVNVDSQVSSLIKLLAPHVLLPAAQKIVEYIIRIYDAHVYHKESLLCSFLPFFETSIFSRLIQCLSLEKDQEYGFFHNFAYTGTSLDKKTLIKCLARQNGLVFKKYSEFCFQIFDLNQNQQSLHWKFFGNMLCEILREQPEDQILLLNCLPYISQALRQTANEELQVSSLLAICQLSCRKTLSREYASAFLRQVIQVILLAQQEQEGSSRDICLKAFKVILLLAQYQSDTLGLLSKKEITALNSIKSLQAMIQEIRQKYDVSALACLITISSVEQVKIEPILYRELLTKIGVATDLKVIFKVTQVLFLESIKENKESSRSLKCSHFIDLIQQLAPQEFNQSAIFIMKSLHGYKELQDKILSVISVSSQSSSNQSSLVSNFGDREYSILSALSSDHSATSCKALKALDNPEFVKSLNSQEIQVIRLVINQLLSSLDFGEDKFLLIISAVSTISRYSQDIASFDVEFELLEKIYSRIVSSSLPFQNSIQSLLCLLTQELYVEQQALQISQMWLTSLNNKGLNEEIYSRNTYLQQYKILKKDGICGLVAYLLKQNELEASNFLLASVQFIHRTEGSIGVQEICRLITVFGERIYETQTSSVFLYQQISLLLNSIKSQSHSHLDLLLISIFTLITPQKEYKDFSMQDIGLICEFIDVSIQKKTQLLEDFNFSRVYQQLLQKTLQANSETLVSILLQISLQKGSNIARVFAIQNLTQFTQNCMLKSAQQTNIQNLAALISQEVIIPSILVLLNDQSSAIRKITLNLLEQYCQVASLSTAGKLSYIIPFSLQFKKQGYKSKQVTKDELNFLKTLLQYDKELIQDRNQLSVILKKQQTAQQINKVASQISIFPTVAMQTNLIEVLTQIDIKSTELIQNIELDQKLVFENIKSISLDKLHNPELIINLFVKLGSLNLKLVQTSIMDGKEDITKTLDMILIPYLNVIISHVQPLVLKCQNKSSFTFREKLSDFKNLIKSVFRKIVAIPQVFLNKNKEFVAIIIKIFLELDTQLFRSSGDSLKNIFVQANEQQRLFTEQIQMTLISSLGQQLLSSGETHEKFELLLETLIQTPCQSSQLVSELLKMITQTIQTSIQESELAILTDEITFQVQIMSQLCNQSLPSKWTNSKQLQEFSASIYELVQFIEQTGLRILKSIHTDEENPFDQFMQDEDEANMQNENLSEQPQKEDLTSMKDLDSIFTSLQALTSLYTLLSQIELTKLSSVSISCSILESLHKMIKNLLATETKRSSFKKQILQNSYFMYHSLLIRTCKHFRENSDAFGPFELKEAFYKFIQLSTLLLAHQQSNLNIIQPLVCKVIDQLGYVTYAPVAIILLLQSSIENRAIHVADENQINCSEESGPLSILNLTKQILLTSIHSSKGSLQTFKRVLFLASQLSTSKDEALFIRRKTESVFSKNESDSLRSSITETAQWIQNELLQSDPKKVNKLQFILLTLINQFIGVQGSIQDQIAILAGNETIDQQVSQQLLGIFLTSYVLLQAKNHSLGDSRINLNSKQKKGIVRVLKQLTLFQQNLNQLLSQGVHVELVLKLLNFEQDEETESQVDFTTLKTNSLQLLIEKLQSYEQAFLDKASMIEVKVFSELVQKSISILVGTFKDIFEQGISSKTDTTPQTKDSVHLTQCLMAVLSHTCSSKKLPLFLQTESLKIVQLYQQKLIEQSEHIKHLELQTQTTITELNLFEVYGVSVLENLPQFYSHITAGFDQISKLSQEKVDQIIFIDTFGEALLKASITMSQLFLKFLSASQLEQILVKVIIYAQNESKTEETTADQTSIVLETVSLAARHHSKLLVQAVFNVFGRISTADKGQHTRLIRFLSQLAGPVIQNLPQSFVQEHALKFLAFFKQIFGTVVQPCDLKQETTSQINPLKVSCFNKFVLKLNEEQLRPIVHGLAKWSLKTKSGDSIDLNKVNVFCLSVCGTLETLREFFVPLMSLFFEPVLMVVLSDLQSKLRHKIRLGGKRTRENAENDTLSDNERGQTEEALVSCCKAIELLFKYDRGAFIQNDSFEKLCEPVSALVESLGVSNLSTFVHESIKPLVRELNERINDDAMWAKLNYELLLKTRSGEWEVRLAALQVVEHMFETMRERYLVILNDTIPFLSELLEDEHEQIEQTAQSIVKQIESLTGESINDYLK